MNFTKRFCLVTGLLKAEKAAPNKLAHSDPTCDPICDDPKDQGYRLSNTKIATAKTK